MGAGVHRQQIADLLVDRLTLQDLRRFCKEQSLPTGGRKEDLADRLVSSDVDGAAQLVGVQWNGKDRAARPRRCLRRGRPVRRRTNDRQMLSLRSRSVADELEVDSVWQSAMAMAEPLAVLFAQDIQALMRLGVRVDQGSVVTKATGIGAGAVAALQGDWLLGGLAALGGFLAAEGMEYWRTRRLREVRERWGHLLSSMGPIECRAFVMQVCNMYPEIVNALSAGTLGTRATERLLR